MELDAGTDNCNGAHFEERLQQYFPLAYVQIQLGLKCYLHGLVFKLHWRLRETNVEADDLTNVMFGRFSMDRRCEVSWEEFDWSMMEEQLRFREEVQG